MDSEEQVHLRESSVMFPLEAITILVDLSFHGWVFKRDGEMLRVVRVAGNAGAFQETQKDFTLSEEARKAITKHKASLLLAVDYMDDPLVDRLHRFIAPVHVKPNARKSS